MLFSESTQSCGILVHTIPCITLAVDKEWPSAIQMMKMIIFQILWTLNRHVSIFEILEPQAEQQKVKEMRLV